MNHRRLIAEFREERALVRAVAAVEARGEPILDLYAPYPLPDLQPRVVARPSRLPWLCFALGVIGAGFKVWFEFWTSAVNWPLNVGGKPWNSLFAFIPVTFEVMVLFAAVSLIIAFFARSSLRPGRRVSEASRRAASDGFLLALKARRSAEEQALLVAMLREQGAVRVTEEAEE